MFKKNSWIVALLMVVAITFFGCLDALDDDDGEGLVETVVYDLAAFLEDLTPRTITTQGQFDAAFGKDFMVQSGGEFANNHIDFEIFDEGGVNKLRVNAKASWGAGLDLRHNEMQFRGGDTILLIGKIVSGMSGALILNTNHAAHAPAGGGAKLEGEFNQTITLTAADAAAINSASPKTIRIRADGANSPGVYVLEQVKVVGMRPAGFEPEAGNDYVLPESGVVEDAIGNIHFYLDLNEFVGIPTNGPMNWGAAPPTVEVSREDVQLSFPAPERSTIAFKFTDAQKAAMLKAGEVKMEIAGTTNNVAQLRWAIGHTSESNWNSSNASANTALNGKVDYTFNWTGRMNLRTEAMLEALIIQKMTNNLAAEVEIEYIKISLPAINPIDDFDISVSAPIAGWKAPSVSFTSDQVEGEAVFWSPALIDIPEKDDPRFNISTTYTAHFKLNAKPGYTIDGFAHGTNFQVSIGGASATANATYNAINQTIRVTFAATGAAFIPLIDDGEGDADLNDTFTPTPSATKVFSLSDLDELSGFAGAGSSIAFVNGGINVALEGADNWRGLDILLDDLDLDLENREYKITVFGYIIGATTGAVFCFDGHTGPNWPGQIANSGTPITGFYESFKITGEIPELWMAGGMGGGSNSTPQTAIRLNRSAGSHSAFRVTLVEIEDIGARD